jgi:hypothetical protein
MARSLDGLVLAPVADQAPGQVGTRTRFAYHEKDGEIWAEYAGGDVVRGHLVGTRAGDRLDFRYVQLKADGTHVVGALRLPGRRVARRARAPGGDLGVGVPGGQRDKCGRRGQRGLTLCNRSPDRAP